MTTKPLEARPVGAPPEALILFHGAGGDRNHRLFLALEAELGVPVARCNFPFRDKGPGRRPPDRMPKLIESIEAQVQEWSQRWSIDPCHIVLGGRSMGGRAASIAVAQGLPAAGLLLLSYPLHPPKKPEKLRTEHFGDLNLPALFVQGESDPFGTKAEFARHLKAIPGAVSQLWLERTGHDPVPRCDALILATVSDWMSGSLGLSSSSSLPAVSG